jgi:hypothetical protein
MKPTETAALAITAAGLPGQALDAAIAAARIASPILTGADGRLHAALPADFKIIALPDDGSLPPWPRQRVIVDDRASLVAYANRHSDKGRSVLIADFDKGTVSARLDWHPHNEAEGFGDAAPDQHSCTLKLRFSEEFARWNAQAGKLLPQDEFARFLEENSGDVGFPEAATMIEISRDFEATVGQSYKSSVRLDNGDRRLVFESETKALNDVTIPQKFTLSIPIYNGEEPDTLTCLFRWRAAGGGAVMLGFDWHRVEYQRRAHFTGIATAAAEETGLPVFMGRQGD